jgi:hypothetical protein
VHEILSLSLDERQRPRLMHRWSLEAAPTGATDRRLWLTDLKEQPIRAGQQPVLVRKSNQPSALPAHYAID